TLADPVNGKGASGQLNIGGQLDACGYRGAHERFDRVEAEHIEHAARRILIGPDVPIGERAADACAERAAAEWTLLVVSGAHAGSPIRAAYAAASSRSSRREASDTRTLSSQPSPNGS